jgi:DNA-nicking Smr family endonuclease
MKKAPAARPDEAELFYKAMGGVARLHDHGRVVHRPRPPAPVPQQRLRDNDEVLRESLSDHVPYELALESGEELAYVRAGLPRQVLRQLRRGRWVIQDQLDLHGLNVAEARTALGDFLARCRRSGTRCVRVIHGKGLRSRNREPILKQKVAGWLAQREEVLAFCQARTVEGGGGAAVVLLRAPKAPA